MSLWMPDWGWGAAKMQGGVQGVRGKEEMVRPWCSVCTDSSFSDVEEQSRAMAPVWWWIWVCRGWIQLAAGLGTPQIHSSGPLF